MIRTIAIGSSILVQGIYVRTLENGRIVIRDGANEIVGRPAN
ncbi:MAG: hypothetical protein ACU0CO_05935 [Shimia sp.]